MGWFSFSSKGMPQDQSGLIVEPVRFDLHAPGSWTRSDSCLMRLAGVVTYTWGVVYFPKGFDANAFAATGEKARAIPGGEVVRTRSLFIDVGKLVALAQKPR
jgi:hypothetical protein